MRNKLLQRKSALLKEKIPLTFKEVPSQGQLAVVFHRFDEFMHKGEEQEREKNSTRQARYKAGVKVERGCSCRPAPL